MKIKALHCPEFMDAVENNPLVEVFRCRAHGMSGKTDALRLVESDIEPIEYAAIDGEVFNVMTHRNTPDMLLLQPQFMTDVCIPLHTSVFLAMESHYRTVGGIGFSLLDDWPDDLDNAPLVEVV